MTFKEKIRKAWEEFCSTCSDYYWEQGGTIWQYLRDCEDESIEDLDKNLWEWIKRTASVNNNMLTWHGSKLNNERRQLILILRSLH